MEKPNTKDRLGTACNTNGGWESWAQIEIEAEFRSEFAIPQSVDIREPVVYDKSSTDKGEPRADFLLPETKKNKGMIIELKCENKKSNKETVMGSRVTGDKKKHHQLKPQYKSHTFTVLAIAWTDTAKEAIAKVGLHAVTSASATVKDIGLVQIYREDIKGTQDVESEVDKVAEALAKLSTTDTTKSATKDTTEDTGKTAAEGTTKDSAAGTGTDTKKEDTKDDAKGSTKGSSTKDDAKDSTKGSSTKDNKKGSTKGSSTKDSKKGSTKGSTKDTKQSTSKDTTGKKGTKDTKTQGKDKKGTGAAGST